jgi:hypothetical protein
MTVAALLIFTWWTQHGAQPFQAHALVKHAMVESKATANPPINGLGHCLYQWVGTRWRKLQTKSGKCPEIKQQLTFALAELRQPEYSCFWSAHPHQAYAVLRRTFGGGARC